MIAMLMLHIQDSMVDVPIFYGDGYDAPDQSHTSPHNAGTCMTLNVDNPHLPANDWTLASIHNIPTMDHPATSTTAHADKGNDIASNKHAVPQSRLRSRNRKEVVPATTPGRKRRRALSIRQTEGLEFRPGSTRPVVYAVSRNEPKKTRTAHPSVLNYTIEDLVKESQMDPTSLPPAVSTSHLCISHTNVAHRYMHLSSIQPDTYLSTATSQHNTITSCMLRNS
jgi:hypothetical protein